MRPALKAAGFDPADVRSSSSRICTSTTPARSRRSPIPERRGVVATRAEYEYAHAPDWSAEGGYIQADYKPGVPWDLLEAPTTATTSTATASIRMWQTPGHAPGHQSFEITLPNSRSCC